MSGKEWIFLACEWGVLRQYVKSYVDCECLLQYEPAILARRSSGFNILPMPNLTDAHFLDAIAALKRSEERRVGKECPV